MANVAKPSEAIQIPQTPQELEQAIQRYKASDLRGSELFGQWEAIRLAALAQATHDSTDSKPDPVPGEDSY